MRYIRIEIMALALMGLVAVTGVIWATWYLREAGHAVFVQDWNEWEFVDDTVSVTSAMRFSMALFYLPMLVIGCANAIFAVLLLNLFRKSIFFDPRAAKRIMLLGTSMVGTMLADTAIWVFAIPLYSRWNADGPAALKFYYDPGDIVIGVAGLGFVLCGFLMKEAIAIARENEGVV
ncbi:MAG: hypothetical protein AAF771_05150 [Pseudomonadota bacterium]